MKMRSMKKMGMEHSGGRTTGRMGLLGGESLVMGKGTSAAKGVKASKVGGKPAIKRSTVKRDNSKAPNRGDTRAMNVGNDY